MNTSPQRDIATALAAYFGHLPSREKLGTKSPQKFTLQSMMRGGDREWRSAMCVVGHEAISVAACSVAELGLGAYLKSPDAPSEVASLAQKAVSTLSRWRMGSRSPEFLAEVSQAGSEFALVVNVGGKLRSVSGWRAQTFGQVVGMCYRVVVASENRRHVRWLGDAAEKTCRLHDGDESSVIEVVASAMLPFALAIESCVPDNAHQRN